MPLMGQQPSIVEHIQQIRSSLDIANVKPKAIVVISAHCECKPVIEITSPLHSPMIYDYCGFPNEAYTYEYPAPGSPQLVQLLHQIQSVLKLNGIDSKLKTDRGLIMVIFYL
jgi:4,5-DOPA dioxygenase extradiol